MTDQIESQVVFITLIMMIVLAFFPIFLLGKNNKNKIIVIITTIIIAISLLPSMFFNWDEFQTILIVIWVFAIVLAIAGRKKSLFFKTDDDN